MPETSRLRVLLVDDDPALVRLLRAVLVSTGLGEPAVATTGKAALELAASADVILLDHHLPDGSGIDLLPALRALPGQPAVVMVTAHGNESLAASALRLGAEDYLIKDDSLGTLLPEVIERTRRNRAIRDALAAAERDLVHAERLAAIGQLNVTLHHTINNPLMAASAEADILLATGQNLTDQQRESVEAIKGSLARVSEILKRVGSLRHDHTAEYIQGVSMIDLSRRTMAVASHRGDAVLYLPDEDLARVISLLLKHAGFEVARAVNLEELHSAAAQPGLSLLILMGASGTSAADPLGGFRPVADKSYTLVALVAGEDVAARAAGADHVVRLPFDPGTLVADLLAVMER